MEITDMAKALVRYLMAMTQPMLLSDPYSPEEDNPFVDVDKKYGRRFCVLSSADLKTLREETGIGMTKGDILSCDTILDLEKNMEDALGYVKVPTETFARMVLQLTAAIGKTWTKMWRWWRILRRFQMRAS